MDKSKMTHQKDSKEQYTIYDEYTLKVATKVLLGTPSELGLILIIGNGICPVDIPDLDSYRERILQEEGIWLEDVELECRYFDFLERVRLTTSCIMPTSPSYLCLMRFVRLGIVRAVVTTNYDCYITSTFLRHGGKYKCILNPCLTDREIELGKWHRDYYYSSCNITDENVPLFTIHGSLSHIRMDKCGHVFALPKFLVSRYNKLRQNPSGTYHLSVFPTSREQYRDPSMQVWHPTGSYRHHIDYGQDRYLFEPESAAAKTLISSHLQSGGTVVIIGLTFSSIFPEDLVPILLEQSQGTPLIWLQGSETRFQPEYSELLTELIKQGLPFVLVNEVSRDGTLDEVLKRIVKSFGESDLETEWHNWRRKWWRPRPEVRARRTR